MVYRNRLRKRSIDLMEAKLGAPSGSFTNPQSKGNANGAAGLAKTTKGPQVRVEPKGAAKSPAARKSFAKKGRLPTVGKDSPPSKQQATPNQNKPPRKKGSLCSGKVDKQRLKYLLMWCRNCSEISGS